MMLRLGIDIDGTVTSPETFVPYLQKSFNESITFEDMKEYDLTKLLNITEAEFWKWMDEKEPLIYKEAPMALDAKIVLDEWKNKHKLLFISARRSHLEEVTYEWFKQNGLTYHQIDLIGTHDKLQAVKKNKIDVFFEDKHDNACTISEVFNIPVILFNTPYNQEPVPKNVIRADNWLEARDWVNSYAENRYSLTK
jgi:hypothetical protein